MALGSALIGGALALGGSVLSSRSQSRAAGRAADASLQGTRESNALLRDFYNQNRQTLSPFITRGNQAGTAYNALLGFGPTADANAAYRRYQNSTGYRSRVREGMLQLDSGRAGAGVLQSGDAMRAAVEYGQDYATRDFNNYLNLLGNQQSVGLSGAGALAGVSTNAANNMAANIQQSAGDRANAYLVQGQNNPFANALGTIGGAFLGGGF